MSAAELEALAALYAEGVYGGDEAPEWPFKYPRISEMTGAIQFFPEGNWHGGIEPAYPIELAFPDLPR